MIRPRTMAAAAIAAAAVLAPAASAAAAGSAADPDSVQTLSMLCAEKGGTVVATPYATVRCQDARSNKGFETERQLCEVSLAGQFATASVRPNRATWACFDPTPA